MKEIIFILQLLEAMKIKVELPMVVRVHNIGTIFMGMNVMTKSHTKHVDIRTKCVHEYKEDNVVKIIFIKFEDNTLDIIPKNIQNDLFDKHASQLVTQKP